MRLGLREANQGFGKMIRAVRAGEEVIITDRGRPFALVSPCRGEDGLERLIRAGVLHPPTVRGPLPAAKPIVLRGGVRASALLEADRREP